MIHFIPAWYQQNKWCENEQNWHVRRMHSEFDDSVKQIQLFHRSKVYPFQIMLLSFAPNLRHFLHRQSVYRAAYWSCFDAIQEVRRKKTALLSYHNLNWPPHIEFVYTPFVIVAYLHGKKYAQIEFGEDGNLIQIDMYHNEQIQRRNIYDDRGFVSSTILYEDAKPVYQDYLTEKGMWKIRQFLDDGHVEVNSKYPTYLLIQGEKEVINSFKQNSYATLEDVISEVLEEYLLLLDKRDIFCVAMDKQHTNLLKRVLKNKKTILSFFENRYNLCDYQQAKDMFADAKYIITDSKENTARIEEIESSELMIKDITPFDTRADFGISQQLSVQKIMVPVDGLDNLRFSELIQQLGEYLYKNEYAEIHLFTRVADFNRKQILLEKTRQCLRNVGLEEEWALEENKKVEFENDIDEEEKVPVRFFVEQCVDEFSVSKCMREQRVIVDMRDTTEVYLRISAISIGIPQLVYTETQFVEHEKNGFIVKNMDKLSDILDFYLDGLANWNEAMVYSYELGKKYTTAVLIEEWKEVIDFVGSN